MSASTQNYIYISGRGVRSVIVQLCISVFVFLLNFVFVYLCICCGRGWVLQRRWLRRCVVRRWRSSAAVTLQALAGNCRCTQFLHQLSDLHIFSTVSFALEWLCCASASGQCAVRWSQEQFSEKQPNASLANGTLACLLCHRPFVEKIRYNADIMRVLYLQLHLYLHLHNWQCVFFSDEPVWLELVRDEIDIIYLGFLFFSASSIFGVTRFRSDVHLYWVFYFTECFG